jgi:hypothetical protein
MWNNKTRAFESSIIILKRENAFVSLDHTSLMLSIALFFFFLERFQNYASMPHLDT